MSPTPVTVDPISPQAALLRRRALDVLAARTLTLFSLGAVLAAAVAVLLYRGISPATRGGLLVVLGTLALVLLVTYRRGAERWPHWATMLTLCAGLLTTGLSSVVMGAGIHGSSMGIVALIIALAGVLVGLRAALLMAGFGTLMIVAIYGMELVGWIGGQAVAVTLPPSNRLYTLLALIVMGLITALVLSRMYLRAFDEATTQGERLAALLRVGADFVWEQDAQGRISYVSEAFATASGVPVADFIGRAWWDVPGLAVPDTGWEAIRTQLSRREAVREHVVQTRDGQGRARVVRFSLDPRQDERGEFAGWLGVGRDITAQVASERLRAEAAIVFEHASIGVALMRRYQFVRANPEAERMLGFAAGALAGQPLRTLLSDDASYTALLAQSDPVLATGHVYEGLHELVRQDGSHFLARVRGQLVDPRQAAQAGVVWLVEDVTERERARRVLASALDQAEAANRAKSAFLATMSHEIRTPLNGTLGMIRLALQTPRDEPRREEFLQHAFASAETLGGIIGDVLDLSRIEAGRLQLDLAPFDLHELVATVLRAQAPLAAAKGLALDSTGVEPLPRHVRGDALRVRQVIVNFIGNAIKFTEQGFVRLQLSHSGALLRVEVHDSGVGITPEVQQRLFQPFVQADAGTTRRFGGTGLGLSICRELATLMGGRVGVSSQLGQGSLFWAELPLPAVQPASVGQAAPETVAPPLAGLRVLVVEDNAVNMLIASEMLRRWGAEVHEAGDGEQALARLHEGHGLDMVLMDVNMPRLNGVEATRALRRQRHNQRLPVIALTAAALSSEQQQALDAGMDDFVAKPIDATQLLQALQRARVRQPSAPVGD